MSPFGKGRRLLTHMSRLSVIVWRRLIFDEFVRALKDIPATLCLIIGVVSVFEIPLSFRLHKATLKEVSPMDMSKNKEALEKVNDHQEQTKVALEVGAYIAQKDVEYLSLYYKMLAVTILDVFIWDSKSRYLCFPYTDI